MGVNKSKLSAKLLYCVKLGIGRKKLVIMKLVIMKLVESSALN